MASLLFRSAAVRHSGPLVIGRVAPANALRHEHHFREGIAEHLGAALLRMRKLKIHCLPHLSAPSGEMARRFLHDLREAFAAGPARRFLPEYSSRFPHVKYPQTRANARV
jgi:hypothetical protein